eukprot:1844701-Prymnesium_polylepis.2
MYWSVGAFSCSIRAVVLLPVPGVPVIRILGSRRPLASASVDMSELSAAPSTGSHVARLRDVLWPMADVVARGGIGRLR